MHFVVRFKVKKNSNVHATHGKKYTYLGVRMKKYAVGRGGAGFACEPIPLEEAHGFADRHDALHAMADFMVASGWPSGRWIKDPEIIEIEGGAE